MNVIPWRRRSMAPAGRGELEGAFGPFFDSFWSTPFATHLPEAFRGAGVPPVNLAEDDEALRVSIELPGLDEKDIEVEIVGNRLVVSGERKWKDEKKQKDSYLVESQYGQFRRVIDLPDGLRTDGDSIVAKYAKGMLEIEIPKVEPRPAAKIEVKG